MFSQYCHKPPDSQTAFSPIYTPCKTPSGNQYKKRWLLQPFSLTAPPHHTHKAANASTNATVITNRPSFKKAQAVTFSPSRRRAISHNMVASESAAPWLANTTAYHTTFAQYLILAPPRGAFYTRQKNYFCALKKFYHAKRTCIAIHFTPLPPL